MISLATCLLLLVLAPQETPPPTEPAPSSLGSRYGAPEPMELWDLSAGLRTRQAVITKGVLGLLEEYGGRRYYELRERGGRVVILLVGEMEDGSMNELMGRRVRVVGLVRELVDKQPTCRISPGREVPQSYCDNPELPPTPDLMVEGTGVNRQGWPRISVTIWSITDITPLQHGRQARDLETALDVPPGAKVSVLGQFGGANLDRVLPTAAPEAKAWVLRSGDQAVWVIGKEPRGNGFSLDPAYRGDLGKWLTVEGRVVACGAARCVRASRVTLTTAPKAPEVE